MADPQRLINSQGLISNGPQKKADYRSMQQKQRAYAAAKSTAGTGSWNPSDGDVNSEIGSSEKVLRSRVRQLVRDVPVMFNIHQKTVEYVVGTGFRFQYKAKSTRGKLKKQLNKYIEGLWGEFAEQADSSGKMNLDELAQLAVRQETETGEYLFLKLVEGRGLDSEFKLRPLEGDNVQATYNDIPTDNDHAISLGIEYNTRTGRPKTYFISDPANPYQSKSTPIRAQDILHGFVTLRPGQLRGVSPLASCVLIIDSMNQYLSSELTAAQMMSKVLGFIETTDTATMFARQGNQLQTDTSVPEEDRYSKYQDIDEATMIALNQGEKVTFNHQTKANQEFDSFMKTVIRFVSVASGLSYDIVSGDSSGLSFSNLKAIRNNMIRGIRVKQAALAKNFYLEVFKDFIQWAMLTGRLEGYISREDFARNKRSIIKAARFVPPGFELLDPSREVRGMVEENQNGLKSLSELAGERGRDVEEILDEIQYDNELLEERGIILAGPTGTLSTNPAATKGNAGS